MKITIQGKEYQLPDQLYADQLLYLSDEFIAFIVSGTKEDIKPKLLMRTLLDLLKSFGVNDRLTIQDMLEIAENPEIKNWLQSIMGGFQSRITPA